MNEPLSGTSSNLKWTVCGMLLLALVLNYMDRQTLSLTITAIESEIHLSNAQYGRLEKGFGYAFALGGLAFGILADRLNVKLLYPLVLTGWSLAGLATGFADRLGKFFVPILSPLVDVNRLALTTDLKGEGAAQAPELTEAYIGFLVCRVVLGFFEAGQWPCALITTQRLLSSADRPFGNSILQSGASIGAILTPIVVGIFAPPVLGPSEAAAAVAEAAAQPLGWWRAPYVVIGAIGVFWIVPWLWITRQVDLRRPGISQPSTPSGEARSAEKSGGAGKSGTAEVLATSASGMSGIVFARRFLALMCTVVVINMTWQYFRVWLPKMLEQYHGYSANHVRWFVTAYYISTDLGCISAGLLVKWLASRGWNVHRARVMTFAACAGLTALSTVASTLPKGPLLLIVFLVIGFGALGLFPNYYSFTQELSTRHQGKVSGSLAFLTWVITSEMQERVGKVIDQTQSYAEGIFWIGLAPVVGCVAILLLWGREQHPRTAS